MNNNSSNPSVDVDQTAKVDIHQKVTDTIVKYLEEGTLPWVRPWVGNDTSYKIPVNANTLKPYSGVNILLLWATAKANDFTSNEWATFKKWNEQKQSIKKGEKGTMVVYYDFVEKVDGDEIKKVPFIKSYLVFNRCQLTSFKPDEVIERPLPLTTRLNHVEEFVAGTKAIIKHKGAVACYKPSFDEIHMPKMQKFIDTEFSSATENYYSTLAHELVHWSGHKDRLDRDMGKRFADEKYAAEELVAELGAAFFCAELNISRSPRPEHASYIENWLQALKGNKYLITTAANSASKAMGYLNKLQSVAI